MLQKIEEIIYFRILKDYKTLYMLYMLKQANSLSFKSVTKSVSLL